MRSIVLALTFAAPLSAVAAPATFTTPDVHSVHSQAKPQQVFLTLVNRHPQDREVAIGEDVYKVKFNHTLNLFVPVGSTMKVSSQMNSKVNSVVLVTAADDKTSVLLD